MIMHKTILSLLALASCGITVAQTNDNMKDLDKQTLIKMTEHYEPQPEIVTPADMDRMIPAPSDAIILFDGKDLSQWRKKNGDPAEWDVKKGMIALKPRTGNIFTKEVFGDCQLHIEWMIPEGCEGEGQGRGNSGVFLQERYEVQILDSYENQTYVMGQAGSIYKQVAPLVNATAPQGKWNVYDIIYTAPTFKEDGSLKKHARITVIHNGAVIQNDAIITGSTVYVGPASYKAHGEASIMLQDHSNVINFRNIWVRKL